MKAGRCRWKTRSSTRSRRPADPLLAGRGIDQLPDRGNPVRREPGEAGVLAKRRFVRRQVDAVQLVVGDEALDPRSVRPQLAKDLVRLLRRTAPLGVAPARKAR